jgi:hypothetical protein
MDDDLLIEFKKQTRRLLSDYPDARERIAEMVGSWDSIHHTQMREWREGAESSAESREKLALGPPLFDESMSWQNHQWISWERRPEVELPLPLPLGRDLTLLEQYTLLARLFNDDCRGDTPIALDEGYEHYNYYIIKINKLHPKRDGWILPKIIAGVEADLEQWQQSRKAALQSGERADVRTPNSQTETNPKTGTKTDNSPSPGVKSKRSTERGEGRVKLIAALTEHHMYAGNSCINQEPIGNNELSTKAVVSKGTASNFFKIEFGNHSKYRKMCLDIQRLTGALKALNGEFRPKDFQNARTPEEIERDKQDQLDE